MPRDGVHEGGRTRWVMRLGTSICKAQRSNWTPMLAINTVLYSSWKGKLRRILIEATCQVVVRLGLLVILPLSLAVALAIAVFTLWPLECHSGPWRGWLGLACNTKRAKTSPRLGTRPASVIRRSAQRRRALTQYMLPSLFLVLVKSSNWIRSTMGRPVSVQ